MSDKMMKVIIGASAVFLAIIILSGCSMLQQKQEDLHLICSPIEANGCIGFAKDKSIMLLKEEQTP